MSISTAATKVSNNSYSDLYFVEGTPQSSWHDENGGNHTLIVAGIGGLHFADGAQHSSPNSSNPNARTYWDVAIVNPIQQQVGVYHDLDPFLITITDTTYTCSTPDATNPIWTVSGPLVNGKSWLRQTVAAPGSSIPVFYDTTIWYDQYFPTTDVELILINSANDDVIKPATYDGLGNTAPILVRGQGTLTLTNLPTTAGSYTLKTRLNGATQLSHGQITIAPPSTPTMPDGNHIHSIAATSTSTALHFYAALVNGLNRTLWHQMFNVDGTTSGWTLISDPQQPVYEMEAEVINQGQPDEDIQLFALDDGGYVKTWTQSGGWVQGSYTQLVPFELLTSSPSDGLPRMISMDQTGCLWQTQGDSWVQLPNTPSVVFTNIGSADKWIGGVDDSGKVWLFDGQAWTIATSSSTVFIGVDISFDGTQPTVWATDNGGKLWYTDTAPTTSGFTLKLASSFMPPVEFSDIFVTVHHMSDTYIWGVSRDVELWGGKQGQSSWEGPSWAGLRATNMAGSILNVGAVTIASNLDVYIIASSGTSTSLWSTNLNQGIWSPWSPPNLPFGVGTLKQVTATEQSASYLYLVDSNGILYCASLQNSQNGLEWMALIGGGTDIIKAVATASVNGVETVWIMDTAGTIRIASAPGFEFTPASEVTIQPIKNISAVDTNSVAVLAGLDTAGVPFDVTYSPSPVQRSPAFGVAAPATPLVQISLGLKTVGSGTLPFAIGLDTNYWLWSCEQGDSGWGPWVGPRAYGQPAQLFSIQAATDNIFVIDTLGSLWTYKLGANWQGPDWQSASILGTYSDDALDSDALLSTATADSIVYSTSNLDNITASSTITLSGSRSTYTFDSTASVTTVAATIDSSKTGYKYSLKSPSGWLFPTTANKGGLYASSGPITFSTSGSFPIVYPIVNDPRYTLAGGFKLIVDTTNAGETWSGVQAYAYKRTAPTISSSVVKKATNLALNVNPILAWIDAGMSDTKKDYYRNLVENSKTLIAKWFQASSKCGITVTWVNYTQEKSLTSVLPANFQDATVVSILKTFGRPDAVNVIWTPLLGPTTSGQTVRGLSGCLGGVPLPQNKEFGCLISMDTSTDLYSSVTASAIQYTTVHEMGHVLGLTHDSAGTSAANLMAPAPSAFSAMALTAEQRFILKNACLVQEQITTTTSSNINKLKIYVSTTYDWGFGDGPGTDGDVTLSIAGTTFSEKLDNSWYNDFEAGNTDVYEFNLSSSQEFQESAMTSMNLFFQPTSSWDTNWSCSSLRIEGYLSGTLKFLFLSKENPKVFDNTGWNWEAVTSGTDGNTIFY